MRVPKGRERVGTAVELLNEIILCVQFPIIYFPYQRYVLINVYFIFTQRDKGNIHQRY